MANYKTLEEAEIMRQSCLLVGETHAAIIPLIKPGATTLELNAAAEKFIVSKGGYPSFKNYRGYPFATCISVNDSVVHGFPNNNVLKDGDIVSVDIGVYFKGYHGDSAYTYAIGNITDEIKQLLKITKESLYKGIEKAVAGNRVGDIAYAIQEYTERKNGYGVVRELVGHGLGKELHEDPQVPNYGKRGSGPKLKEGMVIAIEPMINMGKKNVVNDKDGWTVRTQDGKPSAHYEHNVYITKNKADILSSFTAIEAAEKANENLCSDYY